jgi:DNA-binding MarR family transcriptional regulator
MQDEPLNFDRGDSAKVDQFIMDEIDSVPHLEALLLLWRSAPQHFSAAQIAEQLYITHGHGAAIAEDLHRRGLIAREHGSAAGFCYDMHAEERNRLMQAVDITYRRELIRISGIIHSKPSPGVRAFADAFRLRKDKS